MDPTIDGERKEVVFFMANWLHLGGIRTFGNGPLALSSLTILPRMDETPSLIGTPAPLGRVTNGKDIYKLFWSQVCDNLRSGK